MKGKRYTDEFKQEAVKQVSERGYSVADVAQRLGTTTHSLYAWIKKYGRANPGQEPSAINPNCGEACVTSSCVYILLWQRYPLPRNI